MAEKQIIEIELQTGKANNKLNDFDKSIDKTNDNVDNLNKSLNKTSDNFDDVSRSSNKTAESFEEVTKNGGAIAILDQLTGGLATRVRDAYEATKLFNIGLKGTKTALIATGIGALVVALGTIVAYWEEIEDFIEGTTKQLKRQEATLERRASLEETRFSNLEKQKKLLELQGLSTVEINKKIVEQIQLQQELNKQQLRNLETQLEQEQSRVREVNWIEKTKIALLTAAGLYNETAKAATDAVLGNEEEQTRIDELKQKILELKGTADDLKVTLFEVQNPETPEGDGIVRSRVEGVSELEPTGVTDMAQDPRILLEEGVAGRINEIRDGLAKQEEARKNDEVALAQTVAAAKLQIAQNTLGLISMIAGKDSKIGKAIAIAQTTISTIRGVQNAFTTAQDSPITALFPAYPYIQAGLAGAFGAVQLAQIKSAKTPTVSSSGNVSSVGGGAAPSPPQFNIVGQDSNNQLAQTIATQEQQPVQAYVVANDVTTAQSLNNNIVEGASL